MVLSHQNDAATVPGWYRDRSVLVTGGSGFIGRHLARELLAQNARLRVLTRSNTLPGGAEVEHCRGDLDDAASLGEACRGIDTIFHAAGLADASARAALHWRVNTEGTRRLLQAAATAGVAHFVFLSSVKAMGEGGGRCIDEDWPLPPRTAYGQAKRAAEDWVLEVGRHSDMHVVNLRPAPVYGPDGGGNLPRLVAAVRRGILPPLPEIGNKRSLVHVSDLVQVALQAAWHPAANRKTYIVTDGRAYSTREIVDLIRRGLGRSVPRWTVPLGALRALAQFGDALGRLWGRPLPFDSEALEKLFGSACYCSERIRRELDYRPRRTLADAIPEILAKL